MSAGFRVQIVELEGERLTEAEKRLAGIPGGMDKAVRDAISRSTQSMRKLAADEMRKTYRLKQADIYANQDIRRKWTYTPGVSVHSEIIYRSNKMDAAKFTGSSQKRELNVDAGIHGLVFNHPGNPKKKYRIDVFQSKQAKVSLMKGNRPVALTGKNGLGPAFVAVMKADDGTPHTGIYQRVLESRRDKGDGGEKVRQVMGLSVSQMLRNEDVNERIKAEAKDRFNERFDSNVERLLTGKWKL